LLGLAISTADDNLQQLQLTSYSLLTWPTIHRPTTSCWKLWNKTIRQIFTGSPNGTHLTDKLGDWCDAYHTNRFWIWRYSPMHRLLHQPSTQHRPRAALIVTQKRTYWTISATVPTNLPFEGPPVTPIAPHWRKLELPISPLPAGNRLEPTHRPMRSIPDQLRSTLKQWQRPLVGPINKLQPATKLRDLCRSKHPISIISDASVQKTKQSGFAWVIAYDDQPLWKGVGLAPGTAADMYSG